MMTNTLLSKAVNTGKSPSALQCVDAMRVLLLALTAMICIEASAASRASWLDASDPAASDELERYVGSFEAFHSAVLSSMDGCKNLGSIYQATRVGGDQVPAAVLADAAYADILQCIQQGREEIRARHRDLPQLSAESHAIVSPPVRNYLRIADRLFDDLKPTDAAGRRESISAYDARFSRMQREMTAAADDVMAAAGWCD